MNREPHTHERLITRRASLAKAGGLAAAALGAAAWKSGLFPDDSEAAAEGTGPAAVAAGLVTCVLTPEQTEGPYYVEGDKVRRNITEGRAGVALTLQLKVVDASTCKPVKGAAVDIWHCDATGVYSGTQVQNTEGQTFMRGIQKTNASGVATFRTVYPGWYRGRTVHIHVKVHIGANVVHTGQLYFPDRVTDAVYKRSPYSSRPSRETRNANDSIFRNGGSKSLLSLKRSGAAYLGAGTMGVVRA
jgi:protocatechuate 3,4-dioxygenase beta subunit